MMVCQKSLATFYVTYIFAVFVFIEFVVNSKNQHISECVDRRRTNASYRILVATSIYHTMKALRYTSDIQVHCKDLRGKCAFFDYPKTELCFDSSDVVIFNGVFSELFRAIPLLARKKKTNQKFAIAFWEAPSESHIGTIFHQHLVHYVKLFDWVIYFDRENADILSREQDYGQFAQLKPISKFQMPMLNKTRHVAAVISDCFDDWGRVEFLKDLRQHGVSVDIYGWCGEMGPCLTYGNDRCYSVLAKDYYFYASLENSLCQDYVTEKVVFPLSHFMVPVAVGGANYSNFVPPHSIIDVSKFQSTKHLANFLINLANDQEEYEKYFSWKNDSWRMVKSSFACDICKFLNGLSTIEKKHEKTLENTKCWRNIYQSSQTYQVSGWTQLFRQLSGIFNSYKKNKGSVRRLFFEK